MVCLMGNGSIRLCIVFILLESVLCQNFNCKHPIFCTGRLLHVVQMAGIFKDSKTFVDMSLVENSEKTLTAFDVLLSNSQNNPTKNQIIEFVHRYFHASSNELDMWYPSDFKTMPPFLRQINNVRMRMLATTLISRWPTLGRKIKPDVFLNAHKYSIIPLPHGFIAPGGRFREIYYWDSYWIIKGLLISDMKITAKGMIENFFRIIDKFGFVPNGGRIYYLDRSQPPLLTMMVDILMQDSFDVLWLKNNIDYLEKELKFWLNAKTLQFEKNGKTYFLSRYCSTDDNPRPESYLEDVHTAAAYRTQTEKANLYTYIRTGAETGWDFSGRWFIDKLGGNSGDLSSLNPTRLFPVDLNAILCKSFKTMYEFHKKLRNSERAKFWQQKWHDWQNAIQDVFYDEEDGIWYDYDFILKIPRRYYYPSGFAVLWTECFDYKNKAEYGKNATNYLKNMGISNFDGGIPTSLYETGEQWDLPNAWAPVQAMVIFGLEKTGDPDAQSFARCFAYKWLDSMIKVANNTNEFFEKYNAAVRGLYGGGGEYEVQTGFGWSNGVILELIDEYFVKNKQGLSEENLILK